MITAEDGNNNVQGTHCIDPAGADYFFPQDLLHEQLQLGNRWKIQQASEQAVYNGNQGVLKGQNLPRLPTDPDAPDVLASNAVLRHDLTASFTQLAKKPKSGLCCTSIQTPTVACKRVMTHTCNRADGFETFRKRTDIQLRRCSVTSSCASHQSWQVPHHYHRCKLLHPQLHPGTADLHELSDTELISHLWANQCLFGTTALLLSSSHSSPHGWASLELQQ